MGLMWSAAAYFGNSHLYSISVLALDFLGRSTNHNTTYLKDTLGSATTTISLLLTTDKVREPPPTE